MNQAQMDGLPLNYFGRSELSSEPAQQLVSHDGLKGDQMDDQMLNPWLTPSYNFDSANIISVPEMPPWSSPLPPEFESHPHMNQYNYGYDLSPNNTHDSRFSRLDQAVVPRTWLVPYDMNDTSNNDNPSSKVFEPTNFMMTASDEAQGPPLDYGTHDNSHDFARLSVCRSPEMEHETLQNDAFTYNEPQNRLPSREASDDINNREMIEVEMEDAVDEPYAKLIYRALMSADSHSMVLQEIYQWFRDNTSKGSSDSKGWMNSIRHNLSMNAAFKKTERKVVGDETKKSTEWLLEDFAIRDGVQSTTRYRKGVPNKKFKSESAPSKQRSAQAQRGDFCASKRNFQRRNAKEERSISRRPVPMNDAGSHCQPDASSHAFHRHISPQTPSTENMSMPIPSPYYYAKAEPFEMADRVFGLDEVQGIYLGEESALFANDHDLPFTDHQSLCVNRF